MAQSEPEPGQRPMTDEELAEAREALEELREHDREYLAEQLGGDPDDYRHDAE